MSTSNVIKSARLKKGIKQEDAALSLGVTVQTFSKWENGKSEPKASQVLELSSLLGVSCDEICSGSMAVRLDLESFISQSSSIRDLSSLNSSNECLMLWRFLDNHQSYLDALSDFYS